MILVDLLRNLNAKKDVIEQQIEDVRGELLIQMSGQNHTKYSGDGWCVSRVEAGMTKRFDSKKFAADHADLYASYMKNSERAESLRVEFKKNKNRKSVKLWKKSKKSQLNECSISGITRQSDSAWRYQPHA